MENEITPEQKEQLKSWAGQRDSVLSEISNLRTIKEKLEKENRELSDSNSEIDIRVNQSVGRIEELSKKERELESLLSKDIASLSSEKNVLESEITNLKKIVEVLEPQKKSLETSISFLTETFNSLHERVGVLDKVVGHVTTVSDKNVSVISDLVSSVKASLQEIIDINLSNVEKTNVVIKELPVVFLEVKRKSLIREVINEPKK